MESLFRHVPRGDAYGLCDGRKPRILDLFCGAGGASMGYHRAGFEVIGVDIKPQPNYPFRFMQLDAFELSAADIRACYDAVHASPPCQAFTAYRRKGHGVGDGYPNLIPETRDLLVRAGLPYVIENVEQAKGHLVEPVRLCGSMFGLDVRRHRLFETNWGLAQPACSHEWQRNLGKRYPGATNRDGRYTCEIGVWRIPLDVQKRAIGVGWNYVTLEELSEMVPPRYTQYVGSRLHAHIGFMEAEAAA